MDKYNISLDDVKGVFKYLVEYNPQSIFETRTFKFLKQMHEQYNISFDLYCTLFHNDYSIETVSSRYREEFKECSEWLEFGFHCGYEENDASDINTFREYYRIFESEIYRITGQEGTPLTTRLHGFRGTCEICSFLYDKGIRYILSADDLRNSYELSQNENDILGSHLYYKDAKTGICFIKSCTRLELVDNPLDEISFYIDKGAPLIPIFTHENKMDDVAVREKLEKCCQFISTNCSK